MTKTEGSELLRMQAVSKVYRSNKIPVLDSVDLSTKIGKSLGIVGESGAGKSTLLRLLLGMDVPSSGKILFRGRTLNSQGLFRDRKQLHQLRRTMQVVLQDPQSSLDPRMRIEQIIAEPLRGLRIGTRKERRARVREVLEQVDLDVELLGRYPRELSGGQRQRVALARALSPSPQVLLGDEPLSALDVSVRANLEKTLLDLRNIHKLTLIIVSHDIGTISHLCDQIAVMHQGRIIEEGATQQVLQNPQQEYTRELLAAIPVLQ